MQSNLTNKLAQKISDGVGGAPLTFYRIRRGVVGLEKAYSVFSWTALSTPKVGLDCWLQIRDENVRRKPLPNYRIIKSGTEAHSSHFPHSDVIYRDNSIPNGLTSGGKNQVHCLLVRDRLTAVIRPAREYFESSPTYCSAF